MRRLTMWLQSQQGSCVHSLHQNSLPRAQTLCSTVPRSYRGSGGGYNDDRFESAGRREGRPRRDRFDDRSSYNRGPPRYDRQGGRDFRDERNDRAPRRDTGSFRRDDTRYRGRDEEQDRYRGRQQMARHTFYVTCHPGLEEVVAEELAGLGIRQIELGKAGVTFWSDRLIDGYRANLWLRCAIRVLHKLSEGPLDNPRDGYGSLYALVRDCGVRWQDIIPKGASISIEPRLWSCEGINSTQIVWKAVKDAVCDVVDDARGEKLRPPAETGSAVATVPLYVTAYKDWVNVYRDMSGNSLHRRGYRQAMHRSPLNEAAAAGLLMMGGWHKIAANNPEAVLVDPMCGSGTLLIEAAMMAKGQAPGAARAKLQSHDGGFPCAAWPDADQREWQRAVDEASQAKKSNWDGMLYGNDSHKGALGLAMRDVKAAGLTSNCRLRLGSCSTLQLPERPDLVVTNPPWGLRLMSQEGNEFEDMRPGRQRSPSPAAYHFEDKNDGNSNNDVSHTDESSTHQVHGKGSQQEKLEHSTAEDGYEAPEPKTQDELQGAWRELSDFLRSQCPDTDAVVLSGNREAFNFLRMKPHKKRPMTVGGVKVWAHTYHVLPPKKKEDDWTGRESSQELAGTAA